jgi:outer membrane protein insertion porin family
MIAAAWGFAQTRAARPGTPPPPKRTETAAHRWPIETLAVEGNHHYTREQVLATAGLKIGQIAGKAEFEAARDRLVANGAFESVGYKFEPGASGNGYTATLQVTEVEPAYPVRFEDLGVPDKDIEALLRSRDPLFSAASLPATKPVLDRYVKWIQEYVASTGNEEKIAALVTPASTHEFAILFRPARNRPAVALVNFEGNSVIQQSILVEAISGVAIGSLYTEDGFRELLNTAIRPVYEARGRLRVEFPKVRTEPLSEVQGLHVFVTVDEGQSYSLGKVAIEGDSPVRPEQLLKAGDFKAGDVANFDRVSEGLERIRKALRHTGYMEAKATTRRDIDDAKKAVNLAVLIDAGPLFTMGKLSIVGLDLDGEAEIGRIWTMKTGKPFDPEYPDFFLNRIREERLFDNLGETKAEVKVNQQARTADVTLNFSGGSPGRGGPGRRGRG